MRAAIAILLLLSALCVSAQADPLCGTWRMTSGAAEFRITPSPTEPGHFEITLISCRDLSIDEGTRIGHATATATPGRYVARMSSAPGSRIDRKRSLVLTVRSDGSMSFQPYQAGKRVHLWRWIPYIFRVGILPDKQTQSDI